MSAVLLVAGAALAVVGGVLHPHDEPPNSHAAVFAEYAHSTDWVWVHDLQFLSAAVVVAGLLTMGQALQRVGVPRSLVRVGDAAAAATVALIAVNMAVDGVALKRAVDAWATADPADRASRFAAAETVRWLEWGVNSFFVILLGVTVLTFAAGLLRQAHLGTRVRLAGVSGALAGVLLVVNGLAVGAHGFEPTALPLVATGLYVVMALGIPALDRALESSRVRPLRPGGAPSPSRSGRRLPARRPVRTAWPCRSPRSRRMHAQPPRAERSARRTCDRLPDRRSSRRGQDHSREGAGDQRVGSTADAGRVAADALR